MRHLPTREGDRVFVQVIQGRVKDRDGIRAQIELWERELKHGAVGYLGSTIGMSDEGELIVVARFESEHAASRNSERPEQDTWWQETAGLLEPDVVFGNYNEVYLIQGGGSNHAGFVQVVQGAARDPDRVKALDDQMSEWLQKYRPDHLGALVAWQPDGSFTHSVYFTSEAEARTGERRMEAEIPEDVRMLLEEWRSLVDDLRYTDLRQLWLSSP
jgi:hypothetical protein